MSTKHAPKQDTSLFTTPEKARARRSDPLTSFWAAQGIDCTRRQGMVLSAFVGIEQATQHELIRRARGLFGQEVPESTIRNGVPELERKGLVECIGLSKSPSGKPARLYRRVTR